MGHRGGNRELGAVPQFGAWDEKNNAGEHTSYSVVFTKAREKRKQKNEGSPMNPGGTHEEFGPVPKTSHAHDASDRSDAFHAPRPQPRSHSNPPHPNYHAHPHPPYPYPNQHPNQYPHQHPNPYPNPHQHQHQHQHYYSHPHHQSEPSAYPSHMGYSHSPHSPPKEDSKRKSKIMQYFGGCTGG